MKTQLCILFSLFFIGNVLAQQLPNTNILLFDFDQKSDSVYSITNPKFLTDFNKDGYNNQPYFLSDQMIYLTVQMADDTTQTDIYGLNLKTNTIIQVTKTVESEYSPTFIPPRGTDTNFEFSCVRVETDDTQILWRYPLNRSHQGKPIFDNIENIGYHYWIDYRDLVLFQVGTPHKMLVVDSRDESARFVRNDIGRCFQDLPDGSIAFIEKVDEESWLLKKMDSRTYRTSLITAALPGSEDFMILRDGTIIMANANKLYKFNQLKDTTWKEIADLSYYGMNNITRLAINSKENRIAVVID